MIARQIIFFANCFLHRYRRADADAREKAMPLALSIMRYVAASICVAADAYVDRFFPLIACLCRPFMPYFSLPSECALRQYLIHLNKTFAYDD